MASDEMKQSTAVKLAIEAMEKQRQLVAFDHNLFVGGLVSERTEIAHKEYERWNEAIKEIEAMSRQGRLL